ncbi:MAG: YncE family protein [Cytophagaceae bacterium]
MKYLYILFVLTGIFFLSCRKDTPDEAVSENVPTIKPLGGVFITNEGNLNWGNASVSYYSFEEQKVTEDIYKAANNRPLGDVCQSMTIESGKAYAVVNNSNKVEIIDPVSFKSEGTIRGLTSPRYFLPINNKKAYVSDLYSNAVSVVNLDSKSKTKDISCPGWTEQMVLVSNQAFVTNMRKEFIYIINTEEDKIVDSIKVGFSPNSILQDKNGKLWVLSSGSRDRNIPASLSKINPQNKTVEKTINFPDASRGAGKLTINGTLDTLYFLSRGVYQMPILQENIPPMPLVETGDAIFYGLGIHPQNGHIYVSDAIDYVQKGVVYRYKNDGTLIDSFNAGIIPGNFYFY